MEKSCSSLLSQVPVDEILYIQSSAKLTFKDERLVTDLIEDLKNGRTDISDLNPLRVLKFCDQLFSFDTRRLYCIKEFLKGKHNKGTIPVILINEEEFYNDERLQNEFYSKLGDNYTKLDEVRIRDGRPWFDIREGERNGAYIYVQDKKTYISQLPMKLIEALKENHPEAARDLILKKNELSYLKENVGHLYSQFGSKALENQENWSKWADMFYRLRDNSPNLPSKEEIIKALLCVDREMLLTPTERAKEVEARRLTLRKQLFQRAEEEPFPPGFNLSKFGDYSEDDLKAFIRAMDNPPEPVRQAEPPVFHSRVEHLRRTSADSGNTYGYPSFGGSWTTYAPTRVREMHDGQLFSVNYTTAEINHIMRSTGTLESGHGAIADRPIIESYDY